jgi:hypothetical protein
MNSGKQKLNGAIGWVRTNRVHWLRQTQDQERRDVSTHVGKLDGRNLAGVDPTLEKRWVKGCARHRAVLAYV